MVAKAMRLIGKVILFLCGFLVFWVFTLQVFGVLFGLCYFFVAFIEVLAQLVRRACEYLIKHSEYFLLLVTLLALFFFPAFWRDYFLQGWLRGRKS
jgi:H+/Cl- antiporter ClcA